MDLASILLRTADENFPQQLQNLRSEWSFDRFLADNEKMVQGVRNIVRDVAKRGDKAVSEYTAQFDKVQLTPQQFRVDQDTMAKAHQQMDKDLLGSLRRSIENVRRYQNEIFIGKNNIDGSTGIRYLPLRRVGICVPGASAPLPSTVIMTVVPAQVAGVEQIVIVSAPRYENSIHPVILGLCHELKIGEVYRISGPQAVAAMAWGTKTIAKVDKIVGPSSSYAQLAKREVFGLVDVDSFAGPSDVVILADKHANPRWVAADMLSQAEHAPGAALLLTSSEHLANNVLTQLQNQLQQLARSEMTAKCLTDYSAIIVTRNIDEAISLANDFAAEHLQIQCGESSRDIAKKIRNAGAIFIGPFSPVAVGDYYAGPSHTLPTRCTTRHFSPLSSNEFVKSSSIIEYDARMLVEASDDIIRLAETEGLDAHAKSVRMRVED